MLSNFGSPPYAAIRWKRVYPDVESNALLVVQADSLWMLRLLIEEGEEWVKLLQARCRLSTLESYGPHYR